MRTSDTRATPADVTALAPDAVIVTTTFPNPSTLPSTSKLLSSDPGTAVTLLRMTWEAS